MDLGTKKYERTTLAINNWGESDKTTKIMIENKKIIKNKINILKSTKKHKKA